MPYRVPIRRLSQKNRFARVTEIIAQHSTKDDYADILKDFPKEKAPKVSHEGFRKRQERLGARLNKTDNPISVRELDEILTAPPAQAQAAKETLYLKENPAKVLQQLAYRRSLTRKRKTDDSD